jgi:hypothetical protein
MKKKNDDRKSRDTAPLRTATSFYMVSGLPQRASTGRKSCKKGKFCVFFSYNHLTFF